METGACGDHLMVDRKQRWRNTGRDKDKIQPQGHSPVICFFQLGPTSYFLSCPNNTITLGIHQGINLLIRAQSSGSNHFSKEQQLASKSPIHGVMGDVS
jgi:hypothetical protein